MNEPSLEEARGILERYADTEPHHLFKLKARFGPAPCIYEGYIMDVQEEVIIFSWAPSPFDDPEVSWDQDEEIPIMDIDLASIPPEDQWVTMRCWTQIEGEQNHVLVKEPNVDHKKGRHDMGSTWEAIQVVAAIIIFSIALLEGANFLAKLR